MMSSTDRGLGARRPRRLAGSGRTRLVALLTAVGLALTGFAMGGAPATAEEQPPLVKPRGPLLHTPIAKDAVRRTWTNPARPARGIKQSAKCGTPVVASHPGIAKVVSKARWGRQVRVKVVSSPGHLITVYSLVRKPAVSHGQLIQAGQQLGEVPWDPKARRCWMSYRVRKNGKAKEPARWLSRNEGKVPMRRLLDDPGFDVGTFNVLGASHTARSGSRAAWPDYDDRLPGALEMLDRYGADVVGLQELQKKQHTLLLKLAGDTWDIYPPTTESDTENSIIWREDRFQLLEATTVPIPYFDGHPRQMPSLLLQDRLTGKTFHVFNVHNPASTPKWGNQYKWRRAAVKKEREHVIALRAQGRPVFLTGDFNERQRAFCELTAGKLMISPESIPSMDCLMPPYFWVDWIFAAGQTRFTSLRVDTSPKPNRITDHPLVVARAHLQD